MKRKLLQITLVMLMVINIMSIGGIEIPCMPNHVSASEMSIMDDFSDPSASLSDMGWTTSGFSANESLTIENDALKFVRGATANSGASIIKNLNTFSNANRYVIEYRFKVDNPVVSEDRFNMLGGVATKRSDGTIDYDNLYSYADSTPEVIRHKNHKPGQGTTDTDYNNVGFGTLSSIAIDNGWTKIKYIIDTTTGLYSLYVNDRYDTTAINLHFMASDNVVNLQNIVFSSSNAAITASATMYIDYLKAYAINNVIPTDGREYLIYDTFDNLPDGYIPTRNEDGYNINYSKGLSGNGSYPAISGQGATVQGGALRMTMKADSSSASSMNIYRYIDPVKAPATGLMTMEYDVNFDVNTFIPSSFVKLNGKSSSDVAMTEIISTLSSGNSLLTKRYSGPTKTILSSTGKVNTDGTFAPEANSNQWFTIKYIINLDTKLFDVYLTNRATGAVVNSALGYQLNITPNNAQVLSKLTDIYFAIGESSSQPDNSTQGIYWIDNIKLYYNSTDGGLSVSSVQPLNGTVRAASTTSPYIRFDRAVSPDTVTPENIKVIKSDGTPVTGYTTTLQNLAGVDREVKITFNSSALDSLTTYYMIISKDVKGVDGTFLNIPAIYSFTTADSNMVFEDFNSITTGTAVSALPNWTVTNSNDPVSTATVTNDNSLNAIKINKINTTANSTITLTRTNPFTAPGKYAVEFTTKVNGFNSVFDGFPSIGAQKGGMDVASDALKFGTGTAGKYFLNYQSGGSEIISSWNYYNAMWHTFKYVIDTNTDKFDLFLDGALFKEDTVSALPFDMDFKNSGTRVDIDGLKNISFTIKTTTTSANASAFYIDNFAIYPVNDDLSVCGEIPSNGSVGAGLNDSISLILSRDTIATTVTQEMFSVQSEDGDKINVTGMTLNSLSGQNRLINLSTSLLVAGTKYIVTMAPGAVDMSGAKMTMPYSFEFTTAGQKPAPQSIHDNFNKTADGQLPDGWTVNKSSALPEDDIAVYGGALKILKSASALNSKIFVVRKNLVDTNMAKTIIEFNARFESHGQSLESFPAINGYKGINTTPFFIAGGKNSDSSYGVKYENGSNDYVSIINNITDDTNRWYKIKYVINPMTDKFDVYLDGVALPTCSKLPFQIVSGTQALDTDGIGDITFLVRCTDVSSSDETVWIDDFSIYKLVDDLAITSVTPLNSAENIGVDTTWKAVFSRPLNANTLKDNIVVTDDNGNNVYCSPVLGADLKTVELRFTSYLEANTIYTVRVKKDVSDNDSATMAEDAVYTFKTNDSIPGTVIIDDFENVAIGTSPTDGWTSDLRSVEAGDSFTVEHDTQNTGNKALKIVKKGARLDSYYSITKAYNGAEFGKISVSYKMRFEKHAQYFNSGGSISGYKYQTDGSKKAFQPVVPIFSYGNILYAKYGTNGGSNFSVLSNMNADNTKWYNFQYVIDTDKDTYDIYVDGKLLKSESKFAIAGDAAMDIDGLNNLYFGMKCSSDTAGESIYWVDDITVRKINPLAVTYAEIPQNASNVALSPVQTLYFNMDVDPTTITKSSVQVLRGDIVLPAENYNINIQANKLQITFNKNLDYKTNYSIRVIKGVKPTSANSDILKETYVSTFTTRATPFDVEYVNIVDTSGNPVTSLMDVSGQTIKVIGAIKNIDMPAEQSYAMTISLVNSSDAMLSYKCLTGVVKVGDEKTFEVLIDVPQDANNEYKINYFIWDSYLGMKKLFQYVVKP